MYSVYIIHICNWYCTQDRHLVMHYPQCTATTVPMRSLTVRKVLGPTWSRTNPVLFSVIHLGPCKISRLSIVQPPDGERFNSEVLRTSFSRVPVITANRSDWSSVNANVVTLVSTDRLFLLKRIGHTAHTEGKRKVEQLAIAAEDIDLMLWHVG